MQPPRFILAMVLLGLALLLAAAVLSKPERVMLIFGFIPIPFILFVRTTRVATFTILLVSVILLFLLLYLLWLL